MKKILTSLIIIACLAANLTSCQKTITQKIWNNNFFNEIFYNFLISRDGQFIVFLSNKYHYVFNDHSGKIKKLILWKKSHDALHLNLDKTFLNLDAQNNLQGEVFVDADLEKLNQLDINTLKSIGFYFNSNKMSVNFKIFGKRYQAPPNLANRTSRLSAPYNVRVFYKIQPHQKILKASLTPITLVLDTLMISGKILSFPFKD
ncbi:hypothetical protein LBMAG18_02420 [Alphaproteobacteria bacterium]|nr:hypothetical protein LBMAG18_02420 [Alphaproteobacteria bacterium]